MLEAAAVQKDRPVAAGPACGSLRLARPKLDRLVSAAYRAERQRPAIPVLADAHPQGVAQDQSASRLQRHRGRTRAEDPSAAVRREALLLVRDVDPAKAKPLILDLAKQYDGKDRFYLEAIGIAVGHHDKARRDVILADFDKEFPDGTTRSPTSCGSCNRRR